MRNIITFFAKNGLWVNSLIFIIFLTGIISTLQIKRSFFPEKETKELNIDSYPNFPGKASDVEQKITNKIEQALRKVAGVERFTSYSTEGKSNVRVVLSSSKGVESKRVEIENIVKNLRLPVSRQTVNLRVRLEPVIDLVLFGAIDLDQLRVKSNQVERDLYNSGVIKSVSVRGKPDKEVRIEVKKVDLLRHHLSIKDISNRINQLNSDAASGTLTSHENTYSLKTWSKTDDIEKIKKLPILFSADGSVVRLQDIASVKVYYEEVSSFYNNERSITLSIRKTQKEDIIAITDWVYRYARKYNKQHASSKIDVIKDQSLQVRGGIMVLSKNGLFGLFLVVVVLGVFLNFKTSVWVAFGIPLSFFGMMVFLNLMGYTINQLSMFGMIVVVGILVDDGIVIGENIVNHLEKGKKGLQAAIDGTVEVFPSVFSSVATTVVAFAALLFLEGNVGQLVIQLAFVVIISLVFSLVEASLILPNHLKHLTLKKEAAWKRTLNHIIDTLRGKYYASLLRAMLAYRWLISLSVLLFFSLFLVLLIQTKKIQFSSFPHIEAGSIEVSLLLKKGISKEKTQETLNHIITQINELSEELLDDGKKVIISTNTFLGSSKVGNGSSAAMVSVLLNPERTKTNSEIIQHIRHKIGFLAETEKYSIGIEQFFGKPLSIYLSGDNGDELQKFKQEVIDTLKTFEKLEDVNSDEGAIQNVLNIQLKEKALFLGVTQQTINEQIKEQLNGRTVQSIQDHSEEIPLRIFLEKKDRDELADIENMMIKVGNRHIPLSELATIQKDYSSNFIRHYNGQRQIKIEANQRNDEEPIADLIKDIESNILPSINAKYPSVSLSKGGQQKEDEKFIKSAQIASAILIPIIILMIALSLKSVAQAILILFMLLPSVIGSLIGHAIESTIVVTMSYVGFISLVGIVVNDAIVFADRFNALLKEGLSFSEALVEAGKSRFRAILLTSITTIAGLYPLVLEQSTHANFLKPMAISVAYGVLFGTIFILLFFPLLIAMTNDLRKYHYMIRARIGYLFLYLWEGNKAQRDRSIPTKEELEPANRRNEKD